MKNTFFTLLICIGVLSLSSQSSYEDSIYIVNNYVKMERKITMRDGIKLFTSIYYPKDTSTKHPILMERTPYSCTPYGNEFRDFWNRSTREYLTQENFIIVIQDVRGKCMSEGIYENVRPYNTNKKNNADIDEASDAYDAIDWLVKNVPGNNGKVGVSGISYPGFYAAMAALSGHPALKAVSPQAPVSDWWIGDDAHHNGAFFLLDNFDFHYTFGKPDGGNRKTPHPRFIYNSKDNYDFHLKMGSIKSLTNKTHIGDSVKFWRDAMNHPDYDDFWKSHSLIYALKDIKPAVLTTGGLFDAEDCWGGWNVYKTIEKNCKGIENKIVVGPWFHGGWERSDGSFLGNVQFSKGVSDYYFKNLELPFFNYHLKGKGDISKMAEATIYVTGENKWYEFTSWPPVNTGSKAIYFQRNGGLSFSKPTESKSFTEYTSDPANPVPYTEDIHMRRTREYMTDDQRFASRRPDVLTFTTDALTEDIALAGPIIAKLLVSLSTTDADFIVKVVDVFPDGFKYSGSEKYPMSGYQMMVRGEVFRGRYRNNFSVPEPFTPNKITEVKFELPDVAHTFKKGHKLMIQVQSSWFPLVDRNPQQFVDIYHCDEKDFIKSDIKVFHDSVNSSCILLPVLKK